MTPGRPWRVAAFAAAVLLVAGSVGTLGLLSTDATAQATSTYAVEQGGSCVDVRPFEGSATAAAFYDYRVLEGYSSHGTLAFQGSQQSQLFLYRGPEGTSLVFLHDALGDETGGGAITFDVDGLPASREWVVEDDDYTHQDDRYDHGATSSSIDWMWGPNRTDGAMVRGLADGSYDAVTVSPAFGEESWAYRERNETWEHATDDVTAWNVRAPDGSDGGAVVATLAKDQPVSIRAGTCATPTPSPSPTPTDSPTSTPTSSPSPTPTDSPTSTPTSSQSPTPTDSPTSSPTDSPTPTPTDTPTSSPTDSPTSSPTDSPTSSPTDTPTSSPTETQSPTPSPTETPTSSPTETRGRSNGGGEDGGGGSGGSSGFSAQVPGGSVDTTASLEPSATPTRATTLTESDSPTAPGGTPGTATRTGTGTADAFEVVSDATSTPVPETTTADAFRLGAYIALAIVALRTLRVAEREE